MNWFAAAASIFGSVLGYQGGKDQERLGRDQEKLAERDALLGKRELQEQVRRQSNEDARLRSSALARAAASGAEVTSGSIATFLTYQEEEQGRQLNWLKTSGASKIRLKLEGDRLRAKSTQQQGKNQQWGSLITGAVGAFGYADKQGLFEGWGKSYSAPGFERR